MQRLKCSISYRWRSTVVFQNVLQAQFLLLPKCSPGHRRTWERERFVWMYQPHTPVCMQQLMTFVPIRKMGESLACDAILLSYKMYSVKLGGRAKPHVYARNSQLHDVCICISIPFEWLTCYRRVLPGNGSRAHRPGPESGSTCRDLGLDVTCLPLDLKSSFRDSDVLI